MPSAYLIQVIHKETKKVVQAWEPGLSVEKEFISELCERVVAKGVGIGRTTAHVKADVLEACQELLHELKSQV
jgi:hypothetical protein